MFGLRKHGSGGWRAAYGTDLKPQPWKRCHPPCFRRVIGPAKALYRNPFSASRRAEKKKKQKETRRSPPPAPTSWAGPFSPAPGFGSRHNIQAVGGAKPRLVRRSASARRWKRLSETHGCNQNDFSGRLALSGREQSPRPLNAKRPQGPATPQPWVTLRACRRSLHPRLCSFAPTALSFRRKRLFAFQEGMPLKRAVSKRLHCLPP